MKHKDLPELSVLQDIDIHTPAHQKALRDKLLAMHPTRRRAPLRIADTVRTVGFHVRAVAASRRVISAGLGVVVVVVLLWGLLMWLPASGTAPNKKLIVDAPQKIQPVPLSDVLGAAIVPTGKKCGGCATTSTAAASTPAMDMAMTPSQSAASTSVPSAVLPAIGRPASTTSANTPSPSVDQPAVLSSNVNVNIDINGRSNAVEVSVLGFDVDILVDVDNKKDKDKDKKEKAEKQNKNAK